MVRKCLAVIALAAFGMFCGAEELQKFVTYEAFGAKGDGKTNDMPAIIKAHDYANKHNLPVRARDDANYYIGVTNKSAVVMTSVNWGKARFTIDDRNLNGKFRVYIFHVDTLNRFFSIRDKVKRLKKGQKNIGFAPRTPGLVIVRNAGIKQFIRYGNNANNGSAMRDIFLVDADGNVDPSTPIMWDFDHISTITFRCINDPAITLEGGVFTTLANAEKGVHKGVARSIAVTRSNVTIDGITHLVIEPDSRESYPYGGFLTIGTCANIKVKNSVFTGRKRYYYRRPDNTMFSTGTYDLALQQVINAEFYNCRQSNDIFDNKYWGISGTNRCRNLVFDRCTLSRIDAHTGVNNLTIRNCTLGHAGVHVTGFGTLLMENCTVKRWYFISLRPDFGSFWDGKIIIRNCKWTASGKAALIIGTNKGTHNFGYECKLPEIIEIDGLQIDDNRCGSVNPGVAILGDFDPTFNSESAARPYPIKPPRKIIIKNLSTRRNKKYVVSRNPLLFKTVEVIETPAR